MMYIAIPEFDWATTTLAAPTPEGSRRRKLELAEKKKFEKQPRRRKLFEECTEDLEVRRGGGRRTLSCEQRLFTSRAVDRARGPTTTSSRSASFTRLRCPTAPALPAASESRKHTRLCRSRFSGERAQRLASMTRRGDSAPAPPSLGVGGECP